MSTSVIDSPNDGTLISVCMYPLCESRVNNLFLLAFMRRSRTGRRTRRRRAPDERERMPAQKFLAIFHAQITPRAHVLRLFLHPNDWRAFRVKSKHLMQQRFIQWIELLKTNDRDVIALQFLAFPAQFVINLSGAKEHLLHFV